MESLQKLFDGLKDKIDSKQRLTAEDLKDFHDDFIDVAAYIMRLDDDQWDEFTQEAVKNVGWLIIL